MQEHRRMFGSSTE